MDTQEDFLIKENKKHVKVKNAYALEVEKCDKLSSELSTCHDVIVNLRNENDRLIAKVDSNVCDDYVDECPRGFGCVEGHLSAAGRYGVVAADELQGLRSG